MITKEPALKLIEGRIETIQNLSIECIEMIYNAGYNDGIEKAAKEASGWDNYEEAQIKALKK